MTITWEKVLLTVLSRTEFSVGMYDMLYTGDLEPLKQETTHTMMIVTIRKSN